MKATNHNITWLQTASQTEIMPQYQSLDSRERGKLRLGRHGACGAIVDLIFGGFALIPSERKARVVEASITWNYTTWLNLAFLVLAGFLVRRFLNTGGPAMLRMMNRPANHGRANQHAH
jgi:hypothetical protein